MCKQFILFLLCKKDLSKVFSIKFRSKHSSDTVLCLLRNLIEQSLGSDLCLPERIFWGVLRPKSLRSVGSGVHDTPTGRKKCNYN